VRVERHWAWVAVIVHANENVWGRHHAVCCTIEVHLAAEAVRIGNHSVVELDAVDMALDIGAAVKNGVSGVQRAVVERHDSWVAAFANWDLAKAALLVLVARAIATFRLAGVVRGVTALPTLILKAALALDELAFSVAITLPLAGLREATSLGDLAQSKDRTHIARLQSAVARDDKGPVTAVLLLSKR